MRLAIISAALLGILLSSAFYFGSGIQDYSLYLRLGSIPIGLALLWLAVSGKGKEPGNLLDNRFVSKVARSRLYKPALQLPTLAGFLVIIYFAFFGVAFAPLNPATALTWIIWWAAIIFTFVLVGRIWCTACPFAFLGDLAQKAVSLNRRFPYRLRTMGIPVGLFLIMTWSFVIFGIANSPILTGVLILILIGSAVLFSGVFEKRSFCKYVCPIGALIGLYSLTSPVELRSKDKQVCCSHLQKDCFKACSMMEYMGNMETNFNCNLCMDCVKACPKNNIRLSIRGFGKDLLHNKKIGVVASVSASALLGVSLFQTLAMMGAWQTVLSAGAGLLGVADFGLVFTFLFAALALGAPLVSFSLASAASALVGRQGFRNMFASFGLLLIPQGVAVHLAHNFNHLLVEGPAVADAVQFSFFPGTGLANPGPLLLASQVFWLQAAVVLLGFFLSIIVGAGISRNRFQSLRPFIPIFILLVLINLVSLYIIGLPMNPRHVH